MAAQVQDGWGEEPRRPDGAPTGAAGEDAREVLHAALRLLGLGEDQAGAWLEVLVAQALHEVGAHDCLPDPPDTLAVVTGMVAMDRARCTVDATMLVCVQDLVLRTGEMLLAEDGVQDPSTMSRTAHQTWRSHVKASVSGDLQVALGVGITEARQLVAVASLPASVRLPLLGALRRGEVAWALVRRFQSRTARLDVEDAARVAQVLFGTDAAVAAPERLDPDGALLSRPWHHAEYYAALDREVARYRDEEDKTAAAQRRAVAHSLRDAGVRVDDDGTATLVLTGSLATMVALSARLDGMARRCRKAGDERTLSQLRADIAASLLVFGVVELPGPDEDAPDEIITPDDLEGLRSVINATPSAQVDLVIPWDALLGRAVCPTCRGAIVPTDDDHGDTDAHDTAGHQGTGDHGTGEHGTGDHGTADHGTGEHGTGQPRADGNDTDHDDGGDDGDGDDGDGDDGHGPPGRSADEDGRRRRPPPRQVGELRGFPSGWVNPAQAREIAVRPGSVFYRLLTDPADGRCIERTIARYAPDADMRRQIRAADVYGRGPGCRRPAGACELDHEHEWAEGGQTSETNLNAKSRVDHFRKTKKLWRSMMSPRRDITWTTLLGQVARTRGHDYRQYADAFDRLAPALQGAGDNQVGAADLAARRDLANQVLYAAIVSRRPGEKTQAHDDIHGSEDWLSLGDSDSITHTDATGARRFGPPAEPKTPEDVLGLKAATADNPAEDRSEEEQAGTDDTPPPF